MSAPRGGTWLVLARDNDALVVASPAVALRASETADQLRQWRLACWPTDEHGRFIDDETGSAADEPVSLSTSDVLELLPEAHHAWVAAIMRSQFEQCAAFASRALGGPPDDQRSCEPTQRLAALRADLQAAFPGADWDTPLLVPTVPDNDLALLAAIDGEGKSAAASADGVDLLGREGDAADRADAAQAQSPAARADRRAHRPSGRDLVIWCTAVAALAVSIAAFMVPRLSLSPTVQPADRTAGQQQLPTNGIPPTADSRGAGWRYRGQSLVSDGLEFQGRALMYSDGFEYTFAPADDLAFALDYSSSTTSQPLSGAGDVAGLQEQIREALRWYGVQPSGQRAATSPSAQLRGLAAGVARLSFGPDGRTVAAIATDGTLRLWGAHTHRPLGLQLPGSAHFTAMAFHPDGKTIATAGTDGRLRLWDVATGRPRGAPSSAAARPAEAVAFNARGTILAAAGRGDVRLWKLTQEVRGLPNVPGTNGAAAPLGSTTIVSLRLLPTSNHWSIDIGARDPGGDVALALSPDGTSIAVVNDDLTRIWCLVDDGSVQPALEARTTGATSVAFNSNGSTLAIGTYDGSVRLWDFKSGSRVGPPLQGDAGVVRSLAFSVDSRRLASGSADGSISLWDVASGRAMGPPRHGHAASVQSVAFTPDGSMLASGSADRSIALWDLHEPHKAGQTSASEWIVPTSPRIVRVPVPQAQDLAALPLIASHRRALISATPRSAVQGQRKVTTTHSTTITYSNGGVSSTSDRDVTDARRPATSSTVVSGSAADDYRPSDAPGDREPADGARSANSVDQGLQTYAQSWGQGAQGGQSVGSPGDDLTSTTAIATRTTTALRAHGRSADAAASARAAVGRRRWTPPPRGPTP
jgi:WD40 repeat protein